MLPHTCSVVGTKSFLISKDGNNVDETHKEISMEFFSFMNSKKSRSHNLENPDVSEYRQVLEHLNTNSDC